MKRGTTPVRAVAALLSILVVAAPFADAKSKLITSWKNPKIAGGNFKRVLVIGMSADPGNRADFEDALSAALTRDGLEVIPGNSILLRPDTSPINLEYVKTQIREFKIDAVVVSRLVSVKDTVTYIPPSYESFYGYYGAFYSVVYSPGYLMEEKTVRIETNVYAITPPEGHIVWNGTSDTFNPKDVKKVIKEVVKLVSTELTKSQII